MALSLHSDRKHAITVHHCLFFVENVARCCKHVSAHNISQHASFPRSNEGNETTCCDHQRIRFFTSVPSASSKRMVCARLPATRPRSSVPGAEASSVKFQGKNTEDLNGPPGGCAKLENSNDEHTTNCGFK